MSEQHFCDEWLIELPLPVPPGGHRCGKPARFKIAQVNGDEFLVEWFCADCYDKRMEYENFRVNVADGSLSVKDAHRRSN